MKRKPANTVYGIVTVAVLTLSFFFLYRMIAVDSHIDTGIVSYQMLAAFIVTVVLLHAIKMSRLFLIMLEQRIRPAAFLALYAETTFVSLLIPFKLGEVFRFYCLSNAAGNWKIGLLSVVIDRFFDTVALLALLIPFELMLTARLSAISMLLVVFLLVCVVVYAAFPALYRYLNRFFMLNTSSRRSVKVLAALEELHEWYSYAQSLMKGRLAIIIILSAVAWAVEYAALYCLSQAVGLVFRPEDFVTYIQSIFYRGTLDINTFYFAVTSVILIVLAAVFFLISKTGLKKEKKSNA